MKTWIDVPETFPFIWIWEDSNNKYNVLIVDKLNWNENKDVDEFFAQKFDARREALAFIRGLQYSMDYRMMEIREGKFEGVK